MKITVIIIIVLIFVSCKKPEEYSHYGGVEYDKEKSFDIRGSWELQNAYMLFQLSTIDGRYIYKKKNHFGSGRTNSILIDGGGILKPIEYISKYDIWEFRNSSLNVFKSDTLYLKTNLSRYNPIINLQYNPTTAFYKDGVNAGNSHPYRYVAYYYHIIGITEENRALELIIINDNHIKLIVSTKYAPSYIQGQNNVGWSSNVLEFIKL